MSNRTHKYEKVKDFFSASHDGWTAIDVATVLGFNKTRRELEEVRKKIHILKRRGLIETIGFDNRHRIYKRK